MRNYSLAIAVLFMLALGVVFLGILIILPLVGSKIELALTSEKRDGVRIRRVRPECVRITWGLEDSGVFVSPDGTFGAWGAIHLPRTERPELEAPPPLALYNGVWMYPLDPERVGEIVAASFVNPKFTHAEERMFGLIKRHREKKLSVEDMTRVAAQSYVYLGYAVMNGKEAHALSVALADRSKFDLNADLVTANGTLYRIQTGVERHFARNPEDEGSRQKARSEIPVFFEAMNAREGHPCDAMHVLYLDGHMEEIPFGSRFPAVQAFVEAFPPCDAPVRTE